MRSSNQIPTLRELPPPPPDKTGWPWTEAAPTVPETMLDGHSWPRISIVTPSYNQAQFLEETIRSVLLQGYPNLEYFIIDGGSTDGSVEIIRKYEPWLKYWITEPDRGQSHAINKGWEKSTGDLLAWINSDDLYVESALPRAAIAWESNRRPGFVHGITELINENGEKMGRVLGSQFNLIESLLTSRSRVAQPSTFISQSALKQVEMLDENLHMSMDWDLWIRIAAQFPPVFIPEVWSRFRKWGNQKSATIFYRSASEHVTSTEKFFKDHRVQGISQAIRSKSLATVYGLEAAAFYRRSDYRRFRKSFLLSLANSPQLLGGKARSLLPDLILGIRLARLLRNIKRVICDTPC